MRKVIVKTSRFLSLVLRHRPESIGLALDEAGWASIAELIERAGSAGRPLTEELIHSVVETNDKQRFALSEDGLRIRARQGHSIPVDLGLEPVEPPAVLFHGTATRFVGSIMKQGLRPRSRQHVHLSPDHETAVRVGKRHGQPIVLRVRAGEMSSAGREFFLSENGVWLTDAVPAEFIELPVDGES
jgi:putative RNA 2'-phosphotransferase